eukprot:5989030-Amphidinium_carterae.1
MLCALTYFMRNPKNWTLEFNTPQVVLNDGSTEDREDLHFRIGVQPVYSMYNLQGVPPGAVPHHYVSNYVSTHPNPDVDHTKLNDFFEMVDLDHGTPDDLHIPMQVK